jgi:ferredoxin-type protein NapG
LRPPGALEEKDFLAACTRCFKCGNACPNSCIHFSGLDGGLEEAFTPYIVARERACILCGHVLQLQRAHLRRLLPRLPAGG